MTKKKILKALENNPAGLSIAELSKQTKLHRNTISNAIKKLQNEGEVGLRRLGRVKVYYLKKYQGLHKFESGYAGKNISVGLGVSDLEDGYKAAVSASKQAVNQACPGEEPSFSLVFVSSRYNDQIKEVVEGLNTTLGENWIGCTTDREINSILGYCEGTINVLAIKTKYMHFGIGISIDYRRNPVEEGERTTVQAIENCPVDRSKFATMEFMRGTRNHFREIVRQPPYFVLTFIGGSYCENYNIIPGMEVEFLEGIKNILGPHIPILGGSASSDFEKFFNNYEGENYVFANGKYYKGGAVVCFVVSELYFSYSLEHGYVPTGKYGIITKVSGNGRIIEEINNRPALEEFYRLINVKKEEFIKNPFLYMTTYPICVLDGLENIYPKVALPLTPKPSETKLSGSERYTTGVSFVVGKYDEKKSIEATKRAIEEAYLGYEGRNIVLALNFNCAVRRFLLREKAAEEIARAREFLSDSSLLFGFSTFGEIGAKRNQPSFYHNLTSTVLLFFDKLQIE